jgi:tetratricopeptide (TPR) repeat protein
VIISRRNPGCGRVYAARGQLDIANKDFDQAMKIDLKSADALNNRCYELARIGRAEQALADCDKALTLRANDAPHWTREAMFI